MPITVKVYWVLALKFPADVSSVNSPFPVEVLKEVVKTGAPVPVSVIFPAPAARVAVFMSV